MQSNGTFNRIEIYAGDRHLVTYDNVNVGAPYAQAIFIHGDWLGTERVRSLYDGTLYQSCTNLPFGDQQLCPTVNGGADPSPMHFTGKMRDMETNLDYFGARYFSSGMGRWMSPDWADKPTEVPYANFGDPQSLNLYAYVGNNPLSSADKDGHCPPCWSDVVATLGGIVNAVHDNNVGNTGASLPENSLGRDIGNVISLAQGVGEMIGGSAEALNGGGEAIATAPLALTGPEGAVIPAAGVAGAVAGVAIAADGAKVASNSIAAMGRGSYTNTHESGKTYSGKGDQARSQASGKRVEKATGDKHVATDHTASPNDREAYKDESQRLDANGGAGSSGNHNKIESPGKNYRQQDGSH